MKNTGAQMNIEWVSSKRPSKVGKHFDRDALEHMLEQGMKLNRKKRKALERLTKPGKVCKSG